MKFPDDNCYYTAYEYTITVKLLILLLLIIYVEIWLAGWFMFIRQRVYHSDNPALDEESVFPAKLDSKFVSTLRENPLVMRVQLVLLKRNFSNLYHASH